MSNLFVHLYESVKHDKDRDSSPEYIRKALMDFISSKEKDKAYSEKIISSFQNEIKGLEIQDTTLIISLSETGRKDVTFTIPSREFYKYIEPDVLDRFGDKYLSDFPYPSFFGSKNCEIYKELLESRFSQNFIRYFKAFQLTGKNNGIIKLKKGKNYSETLVNELKNRQVLAEFIKRNYYHPEQVLDNMLKHNLESSKAIEDFNKTLGGAVK